MMRCFFLSDLPARFPDRKEIPLQSDLPTQSCYLFHSTLLNKTGLKAIENFFQRTEKPTSPCANSKTELMAVQTKALFVQPKPLFI